MYSADARKHWKRIITDRFAQGARNKVKNVLNFDFLRQETCDLCPRSSGFSQVGNSGKNKKDKRPKCIITALDKGVKNWILRLLNQFPQKWISRNFTTYSADARKQWKRIITDQFAQGARNKVKNVLNFHFLRQETRYLCPRRIEFSQVGNWKNKKINKANSTFWFCNVILQTAYRKKKKYCWAVILTHFRISFIDLKVKSILDTKQRHGKALIDSFQFFFLNWMITHQKETASIR